eukprot:GILI01018812.1.p1 GENE.GILI01018812.1~~GILI01018812.1.p1  ORF type:complete len:452 (+),score=51.45 GILI01018812.1:28-1383(+)
MGISYSNSLQHLQTEVDTKFLRPLEHSVQSQSTITARPFEERSRKVLFTYPSLLLIRFLDGMTIDLGHLAVLFVLDADKDGLFSWRDIESFVEWVHNTLPEDEKEHGAEFSEAVHARCVLQMWRDCTGLGGATDEVAEDEGELNENNGDINLGGGGANAKRANGSYRNARGTYSEVPEVMSVASSPAQDVLSPGGRSTSINSLSTQSHQMNKLLGGGGADSVREEGGGVGDGASGRTAEDKEVFEEWFELFLTKNFPFMNDRSRQHAPAAVSSNNKNNNTGSNSATAGATTTAANSSALVSSSSATAAAANAPPTGDSTKRSSATSTTYHHTVASSANGPQSAMSSTYSSLVVDDAGQGNISVSEVTLLSLRMKPKAFSLDAIAAAHALLGVQENYGLALKEFCAVLVGEGNLRVQGRDFACPARALRAFNSAFVDSYWAALRRFGLQPLL